MGGGKNGAKVYRTQGKQNHSLTGFKSLWFVILKVEFENVKLREKEKKLIDKLEKVKMKKSREKEHFDETVTEMADRILKEQTKAKAVSK